MSSVHSTVVSAVLVALMLAAGNAAAAPKPAVDDIAKLAAAATPMKADAVEQLYANRTWLWEKHGAGYFSENEHGRKRFVARTQTGYGKGDWYVTSGGEVCMRALWTSKNDGGSGAITCFLHREKDGVIYQRPSLGGHWYVFGNNPVRKNDGVRKLVKGDRVMKGL
ncbi:hypothetical protein DPM33_00415 [Mesorhizobium hawassense]|uniref:DUF995 domain-containing protein n=1 Tax=Mesorhizobium hawassense TaxID=1209954 RepID=A0A330HXL1_9HYPH|nr:DUF995 domain-containing protein [Mesorhizobium hawassense]RAZ92412.1 hypothetical protein DPM33_00415 [Mesorhizobium hawassense]